MFTGIVETTGIVVQSRLAAGGRRLTIRAETIAEGTPEGASVAVNGVCLTVAAKRGGQLDFDVIAETLARSTLGALRADDAVNLERAMRTGDRFDGHFVQGHADGQATVTRRIDSEREWVLWLRAEESLRPYMIPKGSVAIDGISLTIASVRDDQFSVAVIPTTLERTTLGRRQVGDPVNVESDIIARTVVHHLRALPNAGGLNMESLREHGFL